jgi:2-iminobutanoate/2-iminopropanoate deaminase
MEIVATENAPAAIGPYSQAVKSGGLVFCSGQIALNNMGQLVATDCAEQTHQVMKNLVAVLEEAGSGLEKVVKTTIYLNDMEDFSVVNDVYASYFDGNHRPARATVEVSRLPKDVVVEIDCIAEC